MSIAVIMLLVMDNHNHSFISVIVHVDTICTYPWIFIVMVHVLYFYCCVVSADVSNYLAVLYGQVFIGGLLRDTYEDTLVPMLERCGTIHDLRLMTSPEGLCKGFAFCTFSTPDEAKEAVKQVCISVAQSHMRDL